MRLGAPAPRGRELELLEELPEALDERAAQVALVRWPYRHRCIQIEALAVVLAAEHPQAEESGRRRLEIEPSEEALPVRGACGWADGPRRLGKVLLRPAARPCPDGSHAAAQWRQRRLRLAAEAEGDAVSGRSLRGTDAVRVGPRAGCGVQQARLAEGAAHATDRGRGGEVQGRKRRGKSWEVTCVRAMPAQQRHENRTRCRLGRSKTPGQSALRTRRPRPGPPRPQR